MPLTRYHIRNEYGLADPELYKAAERDDPEALLEGVAMAGLVGVLRQLGDLAEFAAEIFHDLHEEVMATAARGHGLVARVQQLESDFPSIEKAFLSQTSHSPFFSAPGVNWHPNLQSKQNLVTRGDLPRFVMDSYEECRGPPRLFLLDKFDVAGAGACLKRYTDPSFFKGEAKSHDVPTGDVQWEKKMRKVKKKAARVRNGEISGTAPTSHAKLHQLLMEERIENGYNDPARAVKLKKRHLNGYPFDSETGKSFMVKFAEAPSPEHKVVHEVPVSPPRLKFRSNNTSETTKDVHEINTVNHVRKPPQRNERSCSPPYAPEVPYKPSTYELKEDDVNRSSEVVTVPSSDGETDEILSSLPDVMDKKICAVGGEGEKEGSVEGYPSDDVTSEVDDYMDALTTMDSEMETDNELRIKNDLGFLNLEKYGMDSDAYEEQLEFQTHRADFLSIENSASDHGNHSLKKAISSNSYSDTSSNLTENAPFGGDGAGKVSPSNEPCIAAFMEAPSNKLSTSETLEYKSDAHVVPNDMYISEVKIPDTVALPHETFAVDKLDDGGPDVMSDVPLDLPNVSEGAHERKVNGYTGNEVLQVINTGNYCTEKFDGGEIDSPLSVSPTDEQLICSALPEVEASSGIKSVPANLPVFIITCSDYIKLDNIDTEINNVIPPTEADLETLPPMVEVPETCNSEQEQFSGIPDDVPQLVRDPEGSSDTVYRQETDKHRCNADDAGREIVPLEVPCNYSNHTNSEDRVYLDDMIIETVEAEDVALSSTSADRPDNGVKCVLSCSSDLEDHQKGLEFNEEISAGCFTESEVKQEVNQLELASTDSDSAPQKSVPYEESKLEVFDEAEDVSATEQDQNSLHDVDVTTTASTPPQPENQVPEAISSHSDNPLEISEDALPSSTGVQETEVPLQQFSRLQVDQAHTENMQINKEQLLSPTYRHQGLHSDVCESSPEDLNQATLPELSHQSANCELDVAGKAIDLSDLVPGLTEEIPNNHASPASCLEDLSYQSSLAESIPQQSIQEADGTKQAIDLTDTYLHNFGVLPLTTEVRHSAESHQDNLPWQLSSSELLPPASQRNQGAKQAMDRSDANLPFFGIFPEATPDHLEMPPLPPLPPMQWRMGKVHNAPFSPLKESLMCSQDSCHPELSYTANEKVKLGFLPERGMLEPQNPFVPHTAEEDEKSRHDFTHLDGNSVQLTPHSMQMPGMVNDLAGEVSHSPDSFPTLPTISDDREAHAFHTSRGEIIQSGNVPLPLQAVGDATSGHDPVSSPGNLMQPLTRLATETAKDAKMLQHVSKDLEGQGDACLNAFAPPASTENEQPQNGLPTTGGEIAWYPKISALVPFFEVPKPNGNSTMKIPRPRSPLIDAVAAHDKSTLRRVTERVRPQIEPKLGERDSLLEQIRAKSFNLKPAPVTRPSIQGPKTNLKVAAILEKANAIRQALAGSDDDEDDADSWSDS